MTIRAREGDGRFASPAKIGKLSIRQAAELYHCHGWSSEKIGKLAGVKYQSVMRAFQRHGIPRRACGQRAKVLAQHIHWARKKGWTKKQLADHLGVAGEPTVIKAQQRLGIAWPERDGQHGKPGKEKRG